jgi:dihydrofolate synthase/folylpolyglutamate synthase
VSSEQLKSFLESKPLYYKEIDHERVHKAYDILKSHIKHPKTVHIVGTNGKGSTGRMLAHLAFRVQGSGFSVGHYSSPHILKFNERIWLDGEDASDEILEEAHQKLFSILGKEMSDNLTYFEYTTLLAFMVFENCDLMVLEAGLGGEFDATNVCDKELSIITPIGIDHQVFLGDTIEEIAATKIRSIQKMALLAPQVYDEVVEVAKRIAKEKNAELFSIQASALSTPRAFVPSVGHIQSTLEKIAERKAWPEYLIDNTKVALQALDILHINYNVNDLLTLELFGRFYQLTDNIRIDVGHNPLAAIAIEKALDDKVVLIYNSLDNKDYEEVLRILKPKVKRVEIIKINSQRAATLEAIENALKNVGLEYDYFKNNIDNNELYLVFGSFYVVEEFLKKYNVPK